VIASRDRRERLLRTLARLREAGEGWPVTVVDDGSVDGTAPAVLERFPEVRLLRLHRSRGAAARNLGVRAARAPYVAFCDDDSWWAPGSLARAVRHLDAAPRLGVAVARVVVGPQRHPDPICDDLRHSPLAAPADEPPLPGPRVLGFLACGAVVRRAAFLEAGGFDVHYGVGGEEELLAVDLAARGWWCAFVEDVVAVHEPAPRASSAERRARQLRNAWWTAALRRRPAGALHRAIELWRAPEAAGVRRTALRQAVAGLGWVARQRRPVGAAVEADLAAVSDRSADVARRRRVSCDR
jgi:GT2 family glycosyltransferase